MYGYINVNGVKHASATPPEHQTTSFNDLNTMLDEESKNKKLKWCKLIIVEKIKKLNIYIDKQPKYNDNQKQLLKQYVRLCVNRKKLVRDKEVKYNIESGEVEEIIGIAYNDSSKKFTLSTKSNIKTTKKNNKEKTTKKNKLRDLTINTSNAKH